MRPALLAVLVVILAALGFQAPATAAVEGVQMSATINGQDVAGAGQDNPVRLDPNTEARVSITLTNGSAEPLNVAATDLTGHVLGLSFFEYHTSVAVTVAPGATQTIAYALDLSGLDGQATGLINGSLRVLGDGGADIADLPTVIDVRGSLVSVYGLFGLAIAVLTVLAIVDTALALARHRLPANRWRRGMRFLTPGVGIGLVLVFTLSAVRVWVPTADKWLLVAAGFAIGFFLVGYFTPTPVAEEDEEDEEEMALEDAEDADLGTGPHTGREQP
ncbi:hypothetical protein GCM10023094_40660 [Rhodococcus olei]|uniref:Uncharacterized protein n=1 Tax=Rhodococcus olei TaxID=2161675 RepID=A0ABP8PF48_9NOCA